LVAYSAPLAVAASQLHSSYTIVEQGKEQQDLPSAPVSGASLNPFS
jgi:hypothetical protein